MTSADAAESFRAAIRLAPDSSVEHAKLGDSLFQVGRTENAVDCYRRALELNPRHAAAHSNLGLALHDLGLLDEGIAHCARAIALRPEFADAHNILGLALMLKGDLPPGCPYHEWRWRAGGLQTGQSRSSADGAANPAGAATSCSTAEQGVGDTLQLWRRMRRC